MADGSLAVAKPKGPGLDEAIRRFAEAPGVQQNQQLGRLVQLTSQLATQVQQSPTLPVEALSRVSAIIDGANKVNQEAQKKFNDMVSAAGGPNSSHKYLTEPIEELSGKYGIVLNLYREAQELYKQVVTGGQVALAAETQLNIEKAEFEAARKRHDNMSIVLLLLLGLAVVASGAGLYQLVINAESTNLPPMALLLALTGRIAFVLLAGWIITFLGRLHASHVQQAIFYQDRLAGISAARNLIPFADLGSRQEMVKQLATAYISLERNAFVSAAKKTKGLVRRKDVKQIVELVKIVKEPVETKR